MTTTPTALVPRKARALATAQDRMTWTPDQVDLIKRTVAAGCSADEFKLFLYQCARTGLDPLAKQIYAVKRAGRMVIQTGIDGFRLTADRTGKLAGSDDATYSGEPGKPDFKATVTVYKLVGNTRCPFSATARWSEYYPGDQQGTMWRKMPHTMLAKCAEALALRKAFPADLSGVYTHDEMQQAGGPVVDVTPANTEPSTPPADMPRDEPVDPDDEPVDAQPAGPELANDDSAVISIPQRRRLFGIAKTLFAGDGVDVAREMVQRVTGQESTENLRQKQYDRVVANLYDKAGVPVEERS